LTLPAAWQVSPVKPERRRPAARGLNLFVAAMAGGMLVHDVRQRSAQLSGMIGPADPVDG